jgi:hypothetical protein
LEAEELAIYAQLQASIAPFDSRYRSPAGVGVDRIASDPHEDLLVSHQRVPPEF